MAKIECNTCGELVETTLSTIHTPFDCNGCINVADKGYDDLDYYGFEDENDCTCENCEGCELDADDYAGQKYEDMAPPCPTAIDSVQADLITVAEGANVANELTEALIADLKEQNESLLKEVNFCDKRVRQYQKIAKQEEALRVNAVSLLDDYRRKPAEATLSTTLAAYRECERDLQATRAQVDELREAIRTVRSQFAASEKSLDIIRRAVVAVSL